MLFTFIYTSLLTKNLGAEIYGRFALSLTILQLIIIFFSFGLNISVVRFTSNSEHFEDNRPKSNYLRDSLLLLLIFSLLCSILLHLLDDWLAIHVFKDPLLSRYFSYFQYLLIVFILNEFFIEFVRGKGLFLLYGILKFFLPSFLFTGIILIAGIGHISEEYLFLFYTLPFIITFIIGLFYFPKRIAKPITGFNFKPIVSMSSSMMFSAFFLFLSGWVDILMLGGMASKADLGVYNVALRIASLSLVITHSINTVIAPRISNSFSRDKYGEIKEEVHYATRLITFLSLPIFIVIVLFGSFLLGFFGEEFIRGKLVLSILAVGFLLNALTGSVGQVLLMTNNQSKLRNYTLIGLVVNIVLNYFLIQAEGILGAAIANLTTTVLVNLLCLIEVKKQFGFWAFIKISR